MNDAALKALGGKGFDLARNSHVPIAGERHIGEDDDVE